ncbi:MAG: 6-bladed beta-propeller [Nitrospiraceae bacterium]|nr:6-bladed beta-propeller [Nitrospiraceae bacterium]
MKKHLFLLAGLLALIGCSGPQYKPPDLSGYVWPRPPEKARVKLEKVIYTDLDVRRIRSSDLLFGEDVGFGFWKPTGIAVDNNGNIYVSDTGRLKVFVLNLKNRSFAQLNNPNGWSLPGALGVDDEDRLLAAANNNLVDIFDLDTKQYKFTIGAAGDFKRPAGFAFDPERKRLYIADSQGQCVKAYTLDGKYISTIAGPGTKPGQVFFPLGLSLDKEGRLYVVDSMNWRVQIFNPDGTLLKVFGEHGDAPGMFVRPKDIAVNKDGFLLVTDAAFGNFQVFDIKGNLYLYIGTPGKGFGQFTLPEGIAVGDDDKVYVADSMNSRIQIFQLLTDSDYKAMEAAKGATVANAAAGGAATAEKAQPAGKK